MTFGVSFNAAALNAQAQANKHAAAAQDAMGRIASGKSQNKPSDDSAGAAIANKLSSDIAAMTQAKKNANQASALIKVAAGGISMTKDALIRMKALSAQSINDSLDSNARTYADTEYQKLLLEITDVANKTRFNGSALLNATAFTFNAAATTAGITGASTTGATQADTYTITYDTSDNKFTATATTSGDVVNSTGNGITAVARSISFSNGLTMNLAANFAYGADYAGGATITLAAGSGNYTFQVGEQSGDTLVVALSSLTATSLSLNGTSITSAANAATASGGIDTALNTVNTLLANIGAQQKRLEMIDSRLAVSVENLQGAKSTFDMADTAQELTNFTISDVLAQAALAMNAKANAQTKQLLEAIKAS